MIVTALVCLLVAQQVFWSISTHRLLNKLMCRNYLDYQQAQQAFTPKPATPPQQEEPHEDLGIMHGLGGF